MASSANTAARTQVRHTDVVFSEYEQRVFELAYNLTGDETSAARVVQLVHRRLARELSGSPEELEVLIHRFTYDAALPLLLERVSDGCEDIESCCTWLTGEKHCMVC